MAALYAEDGRRHRRALAGFDPAPPASTAGVQPVHHQDLERRAGIEPATSCLADKRSTAELPPLSCTGDGRRTEHGVPGVAPGRGAEEASHTLCTEVWRKVRDSNPQGCDTVHVFQTCSSSGRIPSNVCSHGLSYTRSLDWLPRPALRLWLGSWTPPPRTTS